MVEAQWSECWQLKPAALGSIPSSYQYFHFPSELSYRRMSYTCLKGFASTVLTAWTSWHSCLHEEHYSQSIYSHTWISEWTCVVSLLSWLQIPPQLKRICDKGEKIQIFVKVSGQHHPLYVDTAKQRILYQPQLYIPAQGADSNQSSKPSCMHNNCAASNKPICTGIASIVWGMETITN